MIHLCARCYDDRFDQLTAACLDPLKCEMCGERESSVVVSREVAEQIARARLEEHRSSPGAYVIALIAACKDGDPIPALAQLAAELRNIALELRELRPIARSLREALPAASGHRVYERIHTLLRRGDCDSIAELLDGQRDALLDPEPRAGE